jgi:hypothetical protein
VMRTWSPASPERATKGGPRTQRIGPLDDYPPLCINAALAVVADHRAGVHALGGDIIGSGNGEQITGNKVK